MLHAVLEAPERTFLAHFTHKEKKNLPKNQTRGEQEHESTWCFFES